MKIFLIGYMGAGKTTIGLELSEKLGYDFIDTDEYIEKLYKSSINEIFSTYGETKFREMETEVIKQVSKLNNVVISTGGGTPCFNNNIKLMKESGVVIFLNPDLDELTYRLNLVKSTRPLLKDKSSVEMSGFIEEMLEKRMPFYNQAHYITDGNLETGADDILKKIVEQAQ